MFLLYISIENLIQKHDDRICVAYMLYYTCRVYSSHTEQRCTVLEDAPETLREAAKKVSMDIKCVSAHPLVVAVTPRAYPTA